LQLGGDIILEHLHAIYFTLTSNPERRSFGGDLEFR
jgi:hypothetical protein